MEELWEQPKHGDSIYKSTFTHACIPTCGNLCVETTQVFTNPDELWEQSRDNDGSHASWYKKAVSYWDQQEPTYDGVLGGFGFVSEVDVRDSRALIEKV